MGQHDNFIRLMDKLDRKFEYSDLYKRYVTLGVNGELNVSYDLLDNEEEFKFWIHIGIYKVERGYNINGTSFNSLNTVLYCLI